MKTEVGKLLASALELAERSILLSKEAKRVATEAAREGKALIKKLKKLRDQE